ncbi:MAG: metallophosphoesterase [Paracoccaceae bacterium]|nr:metallophosphoesterase [Paracoccaceae bacterium]
MRFYAIGDIHGQLEKLKAAHLRIEADRQRIRDEWAPVIHLGDLVDRGPDSRGVIEFLMAGIEGGAPWRVLKGNHDRMFAEFVREAKEDDRLFSGLSYLHPRIGGNETLASYGVTRGLLGRDRDLWRKAATAVPEAHLDFLEALPLFHHTAELLFVHAGIRPGIPLEDQEEDDLIWIRDGFLDDPTDHGVIVVHGHTPVDEATHFGNRVALDTGAGFGGPLTAAVFEGRRAAVLHDGGRIALTPP